jgi:hypothetical protein
MKTFLTNLFILSTIVASAQAPFAYLEGSMVTSEGHHIIELEDLKNCNTLLVKQDSNLGLDYSVKSAQSIFAPRAGTARLVRLKNDSIPTSLKWIISQHAKVGDRIIFDKIRMQHGELKVTFMPVLLAIVQGHYYLEDSFSIENLKSKGAIAGDNYNEVDSDVARLKKASYLHKSAYFEKELDGEISYFNAEKELVALAVFDSGTMTGKTYYFEDKSEQKIKRTITLEGGLYIQRHYNDKGYVVARGEVKLKGEFPYELRINPSGFESSNKFANLHLNSEFRPNGKWELLSDDGKVEFSANLVSIDCREHSSKRGVEKRRRYKSLALPDF